MFLSGFSTDVTAVFFSIASEFGVDDDLDSLFNPVSPTQFLDEFYVLIGYFCDMFHVQQLVHSLLNFQGKVTKED